MRSGLSLLFLLGMLSAPAARSSPTATGDVPATGRSCSIADDEVVKIAAWDLDRAFERIGPEGETLAELVAMFGMIDADVLALQGVSDGGREVTAALQGLREGGRCYHALGSPGGFATLFDPREVELNYAAGPVVDCEGKAVASSAKSRRPVGKVDHQVSQFTVRTNPRRRSAFDFALFNVDAGPAPGEIRGVAESYSRLDREHPGLAQEMDRIILGDLAVDGASLSRDYFPGTKALINLLLKINSGLSNKTFDQAVAAARAPGSESDPFNDNILVRRWDQPGTCPRAGYCGGLEEFISARVYATDRAGGRTLKLLGGLVHPPVAARFCKFADSDPDVSQAPLTQSG